MSVTLKDFLTPLMTPNTKVIVKDLDLNLVTKFYARSISTINEEIAERTINKYDIMTNKFIIVYLDSEPTPDIPVESVTLSETLLEVMVNERVTITATVLPEDATHPELTWFSSDETIATVVDGEILGIADGTVSIYAVADDVMSNICTVVVSGEMPVVPVEGVMLQETTISLIIGETHTLVPIISPEDATDKSVTWESSADAIVSVDNGVITGLVPGGATITVTTIDGGYSAECQVNVSEAIIPVENIILNEATMLLEVGDEPTELSYIVVPSDATHQTPTWASSDENVVTVSQEGIVTVVGVGNASITASIDYVVSEPCEVTVIEQQVIQVESVSLSEATLDLEVGGEPVTLIATVLPENATDKTVVWASSDENVVTVSQEGLVTIVGLGNADITASAGDVVSEPCNVTVSAQVIQVESVTLNESTLNLEVGGEPVTLIATVLPNDATDKTVTWASSDDSVVTVEDGIITIVGEGNALITASAGDVVSEPCEVTVTQP